jgi:hypothetical protein
MHNLVLDGQAFSLSLIGIVTNCRLFQENRSLLAQPKYDVQSRVSVDLFRTFVSAIGGSESDITDHGSAPLSDSSRFRRFRDEITSEDIVDLLQFLSAARCDISTEVEFIASYFYDCVCRRDVLDTLPFSPLYDSGPWISEV